MRPFVLHLHCYQPERHNPWTGELDPEPSAAPDRDWNARITRECYHPNAAARIHDSTGRVERIVNNYERVSFDVGPTLLAWLERHRPRTYARVLDSDWRSIVRTGHGNAMAQAYHHSILPLASDRDRRTQVAWGLADFRHRFHRDPVGMWLPETAADASTLDALIDARVGFTVLAPRQARRVRHRDCDWHEVGDSVDCSRPYRVTHSDGSGRSTAVYFYDGGLAQSIAFDPATTDAQVMVSRLAATPGDGLVSAALDGETFGHHHSFGELGLAYALFVEAERRGLQPTSYAAHLAANPPVDDVELVGGEGSSWSCAHGVGRWYRDCGCSTDAEPGWNQQWRTPLRAALDAVRDIAATAFDDVGGTLLRDPWRARDDYVAVRLGSTTPRAFLDRHARRDLSADRRADLWGLLEAQRHAMVMYTSCGWFFADVSGIETVYVLHAAARVLGLLRNVGVGVDASAYDVVAHLAEARSNRPDVGSGADVWREQVLPAEVTPQRVAGHSALLGLVRPLPSSERTEAHVVDVSDHRRDQAGRVAFGTARLIVTARATGRRFPFTAAGVHLGGLDFSAVVAPVEDPATHAALVQRLWDAFPVTPLAGLLGLMAQVVRGEEFGLPDLLPQGRGAVAGAVFNDLSGRFGEQYARLYHDHRRILEMLTAAGFPLPRELRAAAELTLSAQLERQLGEAIASGRTDTDAFGSVRRTAAVARDQGYRLDVGPMRDVITQAVDDAAGGIGRDTTEAAGKELDRWLSLADDLGVEVSLTTAQELVYEAAARSRAGRLGVHETQVVAGVLRRLGFADTAWSATT